jgi:hypothetical protein
MANSDNPQQVARKIELAQTRTPQRPKLYKSSSTRKLKKKRLKTSIFKKEA